MPTFSTRKGDDGNVLGPMIYSQCPQLGIYRKNYCDIQRGRVRRAHIFLDGQNNDTEVIMMPLEERFFAVFQIHRNESVTKISYADTVEKEKIEHGKEGLTAGRRC